MEIFMFGLKIHVADLTFHRRGQEHIIKKKRGKPTKTNIKNNRVLNALICSVLIAGSISTDHNHWRICSI